MTLSLLVWSLAAPFALMMHGAGSQADASDTTPTSAIERALVERACATSSLESAARQQCLDTQLSQLRADFGVNLRRLTAAERGGLDTACSRLETTYERDGYLDCVRAQLAVLRARRSRASRTPTAETPAAVLPAAAASATAESSAAASDGGAAPQRASTRVTTMAAGVLLLIAAAAAGTLVVLRNRQGQRACRECGVVVAESGDLCTACRHAAADALRRAATERMEQVRADEAERRRKLQLEEEERRQRALREEEASAREVQEAQRVEENARRERDEEARRQSLRASPHATDSAPSRDAEDEFDPYAVLGVPRDTTPEALRAAYEQARSKYDQDSVAHLGVDVQDHFREKAQAVDRAYQMLAG